MYLTRIQLRDYRNYQQADLVPGQGITVLYGDNAQGKTNALEAVYLCCTGRSHRTPRDKELVRWGEPAGWVRVELERRDGGHDVEILLPAAERKQVKVGGNLIARSGELMGHLNGVLFSPEDLRMVKDGPAERRRFVDMELSQIRPAYYYALQRYNRALSQRNHLLREIPFKPQLKDTLPEWEEQLAASGAQIMEHRAQFIARLNEAAHENHLSISGGKEHLSVVYHPSVALEGERARLKEGLLRALSAAREQELRRGTTALGPHRDDLTLNLDGVDVRAFGSQGQQRTTALSLKLSELSVMREETGEWPVLLLDDVMSELDPQRRRQLLTRLEPVQTLVTLTDLSDLAGAPVDRAYRVSGGCAQRDLHLPERPEEERKFDDA